MATANVGTYLPNLNDKRLFGLDFSANQGNINFAKTANPEGFPPIKFVACRTGISWAYKDAWFETYWKALQELRIKRIAYHVLYPSQPVISQVDNVKSRFPNGFDGDAVVNDLELNQDQSPAKISESCYEFTNRLRDWAKKPVIIYSRFSWVEAYMDYWSFKYVNWFKEQLWWMANYYGKNWLGIPILAEYPTEKMYVPERLAYFNVIIHQNGEKGDGYKVGTVSKQVDTDRWLKSDKEFYELFGGEEIPVDPTQPEYSDSDKLDRLWNAHPELH
jgi:GH25 family lysozyme M1 (1,4-beta-N-acetylmuramidase)